MIVILILSLLSPALFAQRINNQQEQSELKAKILEAAKNETTSIQNQGQKLILLKDLRKKSSGFGVVDAAQADEKESMLIAVDPETKKIYYSDGSIKLKLKSGQDISEIASEYFLDANIYIKTLNLHFVKSKNPRKDLSLLIEQLNNDPRIEVAELEAQRTIRRVR